MDKVMRLTKKIFDIICVFSCAAAVVMMLTIVVDVLLRRIHSYVPGQLEIVSCGMVCVVWLAVGQCALKGEMIQVNIFRVGPVVELINRLITIAICVLATVGAVHEGLIALRMAGASSILHIPKFPFMWVTALGFLTVAVAVAIDILNRRGRKAGSDPAPGDNEIAQ
jgi:TRAP-type C4-dicarboxylate transport system permease small subunit